MTIRKIATIGHPVLRQVARTLTRDALARPGTQRFIDELVLESEIIGGTIPPLTHETFLNYEVCLSVPNLRGEVPRAPLARVRAWDREGKPIDVEVKGLAAGTFQHEVDHLNGMLFVDRVVDTRSLCTWQDFERYQMKSFVDRAKAIVARYGS
jgi:peptide deformylase